MDAVQGGFGSAILEFMAKHNYSAKFKMLGIPDKFVSHGTQKELYAECLRRRCNNKINI